MNFGLTIEKLLVIGVIAALIIGPERLPRYAETLAKFTTRARDYLRTARTRVKEEMGDDFEDVDWRTLDPRRYDPRRIIREALLDDAPVSSARTVPTTGSAGNSAAASMEAATAAAAAKPVATPFAPDDAPPYDSEAT